MKRIFLGVLIGLCIISMLIGCNKKAEEGGKDKGTISKEEPSKEEAKETKEDIIKGIELKSGEMNYLTECYESKDGYVFRGSTRGDSGDFEGEGFKKGEKVDFLLKTDKDGKKIWIKNFVSSDSKELIKSRVLSDGNIILAGTVKTENNGDDAQIIKVDKDGEVVFKKLLKGNGNEYIKGLVELEDGSYVMVLVSNSTDQDFKGGISGSRVVIVNFSKDGEINYKKEIDKPVRTSENTVIEATKDGGFIIGTTIFDEKKKDKEGIIYKIDKDGNIEYEKFLGDKVTFVDAAVDSKHIFVSGKSGDETILKKLSLKGEEVFKTSLSGVSSVKMATTEGCEEVVIRGVFKDKEAIKGEEEGKGLGVLKVSKENGEKIKGKFIKLDKTFIDQGLCLDSENQAILTGSYKGDEVIASYLKLKF